MSLIPKIPELSPSALTQLKNWLDQFYGRRRGSFGVVPRFSYGQLYNDANVIDAGSGDWTAEWNDEDLSNASANVYTIRFTPVYATPPAVLLTANNNNAAGLTNPLPYFVEQKAINTDWVTVITYTLAGVAADGGFNFLAVAPS